MLEADAAMRLKFNVKIWILVILQASQNNFQTICSSGWVGRILLFANTSSTTDCLAD